MSRPSAPSSSRTLARTWAAFIACALALVAGLSLPSVHAVLDRAEAGSTASLNAAPHRHDCTPGSHDAPAAPTHDTHHDHDPSTCELCLAMLVVQAAHVDVLAFAGLVFLPAPAEARPLATTAGLVSRRWVDACPRGPPRG